MKIVILKDLHNHEEVLIYNLINKEWHLATWDKSKHLFIPDDGMNFLTTNSDVIFRLPSKYEIGDLLVDFHTANTRKEI